MYLMIGLGNPGLKYKNTRHNVGFMLLDQLISKNEKWQTSRKKQAKYIQKEIFDHQTELIKPQTFMNNSGLAVLSALKKHNLKPQDIIVVHDDIDLPLGKIRISQNSSSGGNRGVQSIIDCLKSKDFIRLKIGVGPEERPPGFNAARYVLNRFNKKERVNLEKILEKAAQAIEIIVRKGPADAMNKFNT